MYFHLFALALICLMLGLAAIRRCSLYSPLVISSSIWFIVFVVGLIFQDRFYPIQEKAFVAWLIWFMVTGLIFFLLYPSRVESAWTGTEIRKVPINYALPLLFLIIWLGYRIWVVGSSGPEHFFLNLRLSTMNLEGFESIGLIGRFYPLIFALFLFEHVYAHKENKRLRILLWCWMLLYAIATMGKLAILTTVLSWAIIQGIKGRIKVMKIVVLAAAVLALMMSVHFIRAGISENSTALDVFADYIYSPIVALGYMNMDSSLPVGAYVLRFFYAVAYQLNIGPQPVNTITPYVGVPMPTNTYTVMLPFYHDFGLLGVLSQAVLYGLFFSFLYLISVNGGRLGLVLFSGYSIVLVAQFIGDLLIINFSGNLQFLIYALAVFLVSRKACYVR